VHNVWLLLLTTLYTIGALGMAAYGLHAFWLTYLQIRFGKQRPSESAIPEEPDRHLADYPAAYQPEWPPVTVQLPIYNERHVVTRLMEAAAALDYPVRLLEIQLLDDSDDDTGQLAETTVARLQRCGVQVKIIRRDTRTGYKAGALAHALPLASGEFIAIFDADFLPPPQFLKQVIAPFLQPGSERVAFVQGRWAHLNRGYSLLTRCQALALDGHFGVEQPARTAAGLPFGFNGSAGVWRRSAIEDPNVGGWQPDTLCEDLDLAYRAQLAGWQGVFLSDAAAPAEIPPQLLAFKRQQARWATGSVQTLVKLGRRVARSPWPLHSRIGGLFHLGNYLIHPFLLTLLLASVPLTIAGAAPPALLGALSLASLGPPLLYALAERTLHPAEWFRNWLVLPLLMLFGLGLSWNNTLSVWSGLVSSGGVFARTPKFRIESNTDRWHVSAYRLPLSGQMAIEALLALYAAVGAIAGFRLGNWWAALFLGLYSTSFATMVVVEVWQALVRPHRSTPAQVSRMTPPALSPNLEPEWLVEAHQRTSSDSRLHSDTAAQATPPVTSQSPGGHPSPLA